MDRSLTRRAMFSTTSVVLAPGILAGTVPTVAVGGQPSELDKPALWPGFPRQDAKLVAEVSKRTGGVLRG